MIKTVFSFLAKRRYLILFLSIMVYGFALRLSAATTQDFGMDEVSIFNVARNNSLADLILMNHWDKSHPQLLYVLLHFLVKIRTDTLFLRTISLLAFIPAVFAVYKIGALVQSRKFGLLSSLLFSIHPFLVNLGFQQKQYALILAFILLSMYFTLQALKTHQSKYILLSIGCFALGMYTDYSFIWFLLSWNLSLLFFILKSHRTKLKTYLLITLPAAAFGLLEVPFFVRDFHKALGLEAYIGNINWDSVKSSLASFSGLIIIEESRLIIYGVVIAVTLLTLFQLLKAKTFEQKTFHLFLILSLYLTITLSYAVSQYSPIFLPRNLLVASFLFIFASASVLSLVKIKPISFSVLFFASMYIFILSYQSVIKYGFSGGNNSREIGQIILNQNGSKTILLINSDDFMLTSLLFYYLPGFADNRQICQYGFEEGKPACDWNFVHIKEFRLNTERLAETRLGQNVFIFTDEATLRDDPTAVAKVREVVNCHQHDCFGSFAIHHSKL